MEEGNAGPVWQLAMHVAPDRIHMAAELLGTACTGLSLRPSADVSSLQGALELLGSWFSVHRKARYRVVITNDRALPAEYCTTSQNLALQFVLNTLARSYEEDAERPLVPDPCAAE